MLGGVVLGAIGVVLYSVSSVLQTVGARRVAAASSRPPRLLELIRDRVWLTGLVALVVAFLAFAGSTRTLPLLLAVVIRAFYPVLTVVLEHLVFSTRLRALEVAGAAVVLVGPVVIVASGGEKVESLASRTVILLMVVLLVGPLLLSPVAALLLAANPALAGSAQAVLAGITFTVVDVGVRSLPDPFSLQAALSSPTCWIGAVAAPVGLLLLSRAVTTISAGLATVELTVVNVIGSSAWSTWVFGDVSGAGAAQYAVAVLSTALGLTLMTLGTPRVDPHRVRGLV